MIYKMSDEVIQNYIDKAKYFAVRENAFSATISVGYSNLAIIGLMLREDNGVN